MCRVSERNSTVRGREIGNQLRAFREAAGMRQYQAARRLGVSTASMCRTEDGRRIPDPEEVAALLMLYRVNGENRESLLALAREATDTGWWQRCNTGGPILDTLTALESRAATITSFQMSLVPGLLQNPLYTSALLTELGTVPEPEIPKRVAERSARQRVLFKNHPVHLLAIMDESVLRRVPGSAAVMHRQLDYLLHVTEKANVTIRVVSQARSVRVANIGNFHLLRFASAPPVVQTENWGSQLFYEDSEDIKHYEGAVRRLVNVALSAEESVGLITRLLHELESDPDVLPDIAWPPLADE